MSIDLNIYKAGLTRHTFRQWHKRLYFALLHRPSSITSRVQCPTREVLEVDVNEVTHTVQNILLLTTEMCFDPHEGLHQT